MKNLLSLFIVMLFIFSCGKEQIVETPIEIKDVIASIAVEDDGPEPVDAKKSSICNKVLVSSGVYTGSAQDYVDIYNALIDGIGFQNSSCQIVWNSANQTYWTNYINSNLKVDCTDPACNTYDIWLNTTQLVCYDCIFGFPLCPYWGGSLALVTTYNNGGYIAYSQIGPGLIETTINLASLLNPSYLC